MEGGFIWDWVDQSIWKTNEKGEKYYAYGGDYGKNMPTDNGFLNNGIVFPHRTPQPGLYEVKKAHEFINFKHKGLNKYNELRVLVENLYDFTNLDQFNFSAQLKADGKILKTIAFDKLKVDPHTGKLIRIPLNDIDFKENTEYYVIISATTKTDWGILTSGFEVAHEQIYLTKKFKKSKTNIDSDLELSVEKSNNLFTVYNKKFKIELSRKDGRIISYTLHNKELIHNHKGPKLNFWRAPTDNDFGNRMEQKSIGWKAASINQKVSSIELIDSSKNKVIIKATYSLLAIETTYVSEYTIYGNGVIKVKNILTLSDYKGDIPRIGMRMQLPKSYHNLTCFGRGPWENYQDRQASAFIDLYKSKVSDQYVPYIRPQENGYKTDVRWIALSDADKNGILFVSENNDGLGFSALHMENKGFDTTDGIDYSTSNKSKHTIDIKEKDLVQLNIDLGQRGVGGDDSWWAMPQ